MNKVAGVMRNDFSELTQTEMEKVCEILGYNMSPYLSIEAYLYCKGGA